MLHRLSIRRILLPSFIGILCVGAPPSWAFQIPDSAPKYRSDDQLAAQFADSQPQPYAMNYADEAARALGISNGHWEAFEIGSSNPLIPSLKGGIDRSGAMLTLQWRSGP